MTVLAAHPALGRAAAVLAQADTKCNGTGHTCGPKAVGAVLLMFLMLCGGVFLLLQSNFGLKQGYLISGTAFWGCWFVLAVLWFTGVPSVPLHYIGIKDIPTSTPQFEGPQGAAPEWLPATDAQRRQAPAPESTDWITFDTASDKNPNDQAQVSSAQTAANDAISKFYAQKLGVAVTDITVPGTVVIDRTQLARSGGRVQFVRLDTKAAPPNATASEDEKALASKIQPSSFVLYYHPGSLAQQTYIAIGVTFLLFAGHLVLLSLYEVRRRPAPAPASPERQKTPA